MIPNSIIEKMSGRIGHVDRSPSDLDKVNQSLAALGIGDTEEFSEFFRRFNLSGVLSTREVELLDLCSPTEQIREATDFGRDTFDMTQDFVCLTSGEGDGFIVYSKIDKKIYDVGVADLDDLEAGNREADWGSFYELIDWYLS